MSREKRPAKEQNAKTSAGRCVVRYEDTKLREGQLFNILFIQARYYVGETFRQRANCYNIFKIAAQDKSFVFVDVGQYHLNIFLSLRFLFNRAWSIASSIFLSINLNAIIESPLLFLN
jgi:hypothetical protein